MNNYDVLQDYNSYILNDVNINQYLKYTMLESDNRENKHTKNLEIKPKSFQKQSKSTIFFPDDQDSLFWCYFIITNSDIKYELLPNRNVVTVKQLKIQYITKIRDNKSIVKTHKFDSISNIESNLANDNISNIKSIMSLFAIDNINIIFIRNKTYFELITDTKNDIYIITEQSTKYVKKYGYEIATENKLNELRNSLYKISNLDKPIKSMSSYTASELVEIANKLGIQIINQTSGKNKTKPELYELIIQHFDF